jgi:hypothetical protein
MRGRTPFGIRPRPTRGLPLGSERYECAGGSSKCPSGVSLSSPSEPCARPLAMSFARTTRRTLFAVGHPLRDGTTVQVRSYRNLTKWGDFGRIMSGSLMARSTEPHSDWSSGYSIARTCW